MPRDINEPPADAPLGRNVGMPGPVGVNGRHHSDDSVVADVRGQVRDRAAAHTADYRRRMPRKASGADHRTYYALKIELGFAFTLLVLIGLLRSPLYMEAQEVEFVLANQEVIELEDIEQTRQEMPPPPPPRPSIPIEVADDEILEDEDLVLDATLDIDEIITDIPPPPPAPKAEVVEEEPEIFIAVEEMPELIGGIQALMAEVQYPQLARQAGVEGRVVVQFVVDEEGNVVNPFIVKGIGGGCDEEALRAISLMKYKPGRQRGRPVKVQVATSVLFRLKEART